VSDWAYAAPLTPAVSYWTIGTDALPAVVMDPLEKSALDTGTTITGLHRQLPPHEAASGYDVSLQLARAPGDIVAFLADALVRSMQVALEPVLLHEASTGVPTATDLDGAVAACTAYGGPVLVFANPTKLPPVIAAAANYALTMPGYVTIVPVAGTEPTLVVSRANWSLGTPPLVRLSKADASRIGTDVGLLMQALAYVRVPSSAAVIP
jgi:hypothetical protein